MSQFKKMLESEATSSVEAEKGIRFVDLPSRLPDAPPQAEHRYNAARYKMYRAQIQAAVIAAEWCWPYEYAKARAEFEQTLLNLFSQTCDKIRR